MSKPLIKARQPFAVGKQPPTSSDGRTQTTPRRYFRKLSKLAAIPKRDGKEAAESSRPIGRNRILSRVGCYDYVMYVFLCRVNFMVSV